MAQNKKDSSALGEILVGIIGNFIKKIETDIVQDVKNKAKEISTQIKRKTAGIFFILFGFVFLLIGISIILENLFAIKGLGFVIAGAIIFLTGYVINIKK